MTNYIWMNFEFDYPHLVDHILAWESSDDELVLEMDDGRTLLYDNLDRRIRKLPDNCNNMSKEEFDIEFGHRLRKYMGMRGISQNELSRRTGISQVMLSKYITGKVSPSFYVIDRIARALGCTLEQFRYIR